MTNSVVDTNIESLGSLTVEEQVLDISSLSSAGTETGVSPDNIDSVIGFTGFVGARNDGGTGEVVSYDATNNELEITDGAGSAVADNSSVDEVHCLWIGRR